MTGTEFCKNVEILRMAQNSHVQLYMQYLLQVRVSGKTFDTNHKSLSFCMQKSVLKCSRSHTTVCQVWLNARNIAKPAPSIIKPTHLSHDWSILVLSSSVSQNFLIQYAKCQSIQRQQCHKLGVQVWGHLSILLSSLPSRGLTRGFRQSPLTRCQTFWCNLCCQTAL